jgi:hypothetical protein
MKNAFKTRFRYDELNIFRELSENLYPDHLSSIRELGIQNPFDVDATLSRIDIDQHKGIISFSDNGTGMSSKVIRDHFLTIGFSSKERGSLTRTRKRKIIGNKGIGRLSWQKLGNRAEVLTETEKEAHLIKMDRHSMDALIKKVTKKGRTGTTWKISGLKDDLNIDSIREFIQEKAGLLLRLNPDFRIILNGRRVTPKVLEGDIIRLMSESYDSSLILCTENRRVAISSRGIVLDEVDLYGLGGYIDSDHFKETSDREKTLRDDEFEEIMKEVRNDLLDILLQMSNNQKIFMKYRDNLIRVAGQLDLSTTMKRRKLALEIPVQVLGVGYVRMGSLVKGEIYVEHSPDGSGSKRSERAADLGYKVILARSINERTLIQATIRAKRIEEIPIEILSSRGITVKDDSFSGILDNACQILSVISDLKLEVNYAGNGKGISASSLQKIELPHQFIPQRRKPVQNPRNNEKIFDVEMKGQEDIMRINGIGIVLCQMENEEIIALADPVHRRIFLNTSSTIIDIMKDRPAEDQRVLLLDEICHEMAHILGFGLRIHDDKFFRIQRYLKYQAMRLMYSGEN